MGNRENKSWCNSVISNSCSACKFKYTAYGYGNPEPGVTCIPGEEKSTDCTDCTECTDTCVSLVDWCNEDRQWVYAKKEIECQGTNELILFFYLSYIMIVVIFIKTSKFCVIFLYPEQETTTSTTTSGTVS